MLLGKQRMVLQVQGMQSMVVLVRRAQWRRELRPTVVMVMPRAVRGGDSMVSTRSEHGGAGEASGVVVRAQASGGCGGDGGAKGSVQRRWQCQDK